MCLVTLLITLLSSIFHSSLWFKIIIIDTITINDLAFMITLPPFSFIVSLLWLNDQMNRLQQQHSSSGNNIHWQRNNNRNSGKNKSNSNSNSSNDKSKSGNNSININSKSYDDTLKLATIITTTDQNSNNISAAAIARITIVTTIILMNGAGR